MPNGITFPRTISWCAYLKLLLRTCIVKQNLTCKTLPILVIVLCCFISHTDTCYSSHARCLIVISKMLKCEYVYVCLLNTIVTTLPQLCKL